MYERFAACVNITPKTRECCVSCAQRLVFTSREPVKVSAAGAVVSTSWEVGHLQDSPQKVAEAPALHSGVACGELEP